MVSERIRLVIDSDGVSDDVRAISLALQRPNVEVLAITASQGCVGVHHAAANIIRALKANGKFGQVPVFKGSDGPLVPRGEENLHDETYIFGEDGLGDRPQDFPQVEASDFEAHEKEHASVALIRIFKMYPDAILITLGPLTNVALALKLNPSFAPKRMVIMGGNYYAVGNVTTKSSAEWNFSGDPEAAAIVLSQLKSDITIVPWEAFQLNGLEDGKEVDFDAHLKVPSKLARFFCTATRKHREELSRHGHQYAYCDEIAVAAALAPNEVILEQKPLFVHVELAGKHTRGQVVVDWLSDLWKNGASEEMSEAKRPSAHRKPVSFVTKYNVKHVDDLMFETVRAVGE